MNVNKNVDYNYEKALQIYNDIYKLDLYDKIYELLKEAETNKNDIDFGLVNWADLGVTEITLSQSLLPWQNYQQFHLIIKIEEAEPDCELTEWLENRLFDCILEKNSYDLDITVECSW